MGLVGERGVFDKVVWSRGEYVWRSWWVEGCELNLLIWLCMFESGMVR